MGKKKKVEVKAEDQKKKNVESRELIIEAVPAQDIEKKIAENRESAPKIEPEKKAEKVKKVRVVSANAAKSFAAKRLAMAMVKPNRGWIEAKPGIYEKGAHSVSFNTEGHFVTVDDKLELPLGQGAIKLLDKYLISATITAPAVL